MIGTRDKNLGTIDGLKPCVTVALPMSESFYNHLWEKTM
jgi:hypothetical protein